MMIRLAPGRAQGGIQWCCEVQSAPLKMNNTVSDGNDCDSPEARRRDNGKRLDIELFKREIVYLL